MTLDSNLVHFYLVKELIKCTLKRGYDHFTEQLKNE